MAIQNKPFTLFQDKGFETRNRSLRFDLNAMADFEQAAGMGLAQLMAHRAVFAATRALVWAGLKHQDRGLTVDYTGQLMQKFVEAGGEINDLLTLCLEAAIEQKAIPDMRVKDGEEESSGPSPNANSPATGTPSSPGSVTSA